MYVYVLMLCRLFPLILLASLYKDERQTVEVFSQKLSTELDQPVKLMCFCKVWCIVYTKMYACGYTGIHYMVNNVYKTCRL